MSDSAVQAEPNNLRDDVLGILVEAAKQVDEANAVSYSKKMQAATESCRAALALYAIAQSEDQGHQGKAVASGPEDICQFCNSADVAFNKHRQWFSCAACGAEWPAGHDPAEARRIMEAHREHLMNEKEDSAVPLTDEREEERARELFNAWYDKQPMPQLLARVDPQQAAHNAFEFGRALVAKGAGPPPGGKS